MRTTPLLTNVLGLLLALLFSSTVFGQYRFDTIDFTISKDKFGDTTLLELAYPQLTGQTRADRKGPYYRHLILFGDGEFTMSEAPVKDTVLHLYGNGSGTVFARAYSDGVYSDPDEDPPNNIMSPTDPVDSPGLIDRDSLVEANRYLHLFRSVDVRPGDSMMMVLSLRNADTNYVNGQVIFFYNGRLREVAPKAEPKDLGVFSSFSLGEALIYERSNTNGTNVFFSKLAGNLGQLYQRAWVAPFYELAPGREIRFFLELGNSPDMWDMFKDTTMAQLDFAAAVMVSNEVSPILYPGQLAESAMGQAILSGLPSLLSTSADSVKQFRPNLDSTLSLSTSPGPFQFSGFRTVDMYTSTATLVKTHDPNFLRMQACECTEASDAYQILATVQCENDGYDETSNILIDLKLPPGLTAADVVAVPIDYYPTNPAGADITLVTLAPDSIRWVLKNFALLSTRELGVGHPYTYAQIQFLLYSTIPPADLPPMSACIRFEDEFHDPVCTMPAAVISLTGTEKNAGIMACEVCADDVPALTDSVSCPPWWVWLLALVLILLLWWAYRRSRNPGN